MKKPKTIQDLHFWLRERYDVLAHFDRYGQPDNQDDGFFLGLEVAEIVNEAQRMCCQFGAPLVCDEQTTTQPRVGLEIVGRLLAWSTATQAPVDLLTVEEAAGRLRVGAGKVYELAAQGKLKHCKIGRRICFRPADLDTYLETTNKAAIPGQLLRF